MKPVPEYSIIRSGVFAWQGYNPTVKCDCSSSALVTSAGLIFVDPVSLEEEALKELVAESFSAPAAVILTNGNHQRDSLRFARRLGIPILAPDGAGEDIVADQRFRAGDQVAGMESIALPGFGPDETAFLFDQILILGDALVNLEAEGLRLLPLKYRVDKKQASRSLASLENIAPQILLFAHGNPIVEDASERLAAACMAAE